MVRMRHPEHGFHHPVDWMEEQRMRSSGWVDDADILLSDQENQNSELVQALASMNDQPLKRKPGRPKKTP